MMGDGEMSIERLAGTMNYPTSPFTRGGILVFDVNALALCDLIVGDRGARRAVEDNPGLGYRLNVDCEF